MTPSDIPPLPQLTGKKGYGPEKPRRFIVMLVAFGVLCLVQVGGLWLFCTAPPNQRDWKMLIGNVVIAFFQYCALKVEL